MRKSLLILLSLFFVLNLSATDKVFNVNMHLIAPIVITTNQDLTFPDQPAGTAATVTVAETDSSAANFTVTGDPNAGITVSVSSASINISNGTDTIVVDSFTGTGNKTLSSSGSLTFGIGATAHVEASDSSGDYTGQQTLTVVYQ